MKLYLEGTDDEEGPDETTKDMLPAMTEGQAMSRQTIVATQRFSKHPPRYTEASLVKRLEETEHRTPFDLRFDHRRHAKARVCGERRPRWHAT